MKKVAQYSALIFLLCCLYVLLFEGLLRLTGVYSTYFEKNFGRYISYYKSDCKNTQLYTREANSSFNYEKSEFRYSRKVNNLGLIQTLFPDTVNKKLALVLGDSFVECVGAPIDSTWLVQLEKLIEGKCNLKLYNAGVAGSDIFYMRKLYEEKLKQINPDLLIICLNYSDISEYLYRGGIERFTSDGKTCYPTPPKWEVYYKKFHTVRFVAHFILGYYFTLDSKKTIEANFPLILEKISKEIILLQKNAKDFLLIIHPYPYFKDKNITFHKEFQDIQNYLPKNLKTINLYPDFERYFEQHNAQKYYWEKDGHFNSKGYLQMAKFIDSKLNTMNICEEESL